MSRKSDGPGKRTSDVEVTSVSRHGFWLLMGDRERYLSFEDFPWFRSASIDRPADYPLISKVGLSR